MDPGDLLRAARHLASGKAKPRQAFLKRAVSTTYYAMFHCLAKHCADLLIGSSRTQRREAAWTQVYRALDHSAVQRVCANAQIMRTYPDPLQHFADQFAAMQKKRHDADYDPQCSVFKSTVLADIDASETAIAGFALIAAPVRRAFAAAVLLKKRPS